MPKPTAETTPAASGDWTRLLPVEQLNPAPRGTFVSVAGRELAVFRDPAGGFILTDNACPHAGGNLAGGTQSGPIVECPWHQWRFDLTDGACVHSPAVRLRRHRCQVRAGVLYAHLPPCP